MNKKEYKRKYKKTDTPGWDSINEALNRLYNEQEPKHFGTKIKYIEGGNDPLDGISIYKNKKHEEHLHYISYGLTELYYDVQSCDSPFSKYGFEITFRIKEQQADGLIWPMSLMQNLARYVFESGKWFAEYNYIGCNGPIRTETNTNITAIVFVIDPELKEINSPHGLIQFIQVVGITNDEYEKIRQTSDFDLRVSLIQKLVDELKKNNPLLITDIERTISLI